jgi:hypothetical protein
MDAFDVIHAGRAPADHGTSFHGRQAALSSALKRRLRLAPGTEIPGLDQLPEALLPSIVFAGALGLSPAEIMASALAFLVLDILVTRVRQGPSGRTSDQGEG